MTEIKQTRQYEDWYNSLKDSAVRARVALRLKRIKEQSYFGDAKPIGDGVYAIRIHCGKGYRMYYRTIGNEVILLLAGGDKSSQQRDIERAKALAKEDYREVDDND
ncbi:MAG: type II toxin-antitoxin system RelE/ParE family toxin [Coriobacteriales bacterium]|jgi:putative addiction module killer protein|nr:type II toxin-antitoxin system RelE/ParE family toxin [Coriobacteriales bacterium]